jgi:hypothetical protein
MLCRGLWLAVVMLCGCASRPSPEAATPPRINDSIPERSAALRAADGRLKLDVEEQRYGIEAAKERRQSTVEEGSSSGSVVIPMPPPNDSGMFNQRDSGTDR